MPSNSPLKYSTSPLSAGSNSVAETRERSDSDQSELGSLQVQHDKSSQSGEDDDLESQSPASDRAEPPNSPRYNEPRELTAAVSRAMRTDEAVQHPMRSPQAATLTPPPPFRLHPRALSNGPNSPVTPLDQHRRSNAPFSLARHKLVVARQREAAEKQAPESAHEAPEDTINEDPFEGGSEADPFRDPITGLYYSPSVYSQHQIVDDDSDEYIYEYEDQAMDLRFNAPMTPINPSTFPYSSGVHDRSRMLQRRAARLSEEPVTPTKRSTNGCTRLEEFAATITESPE